jgi:hypothetical protein
MPVLLNASLKRSVPSPSKHASNGVQALKEPVKEAGPDTVRNELLGIVMGGLGRPALPLMKTPPWQPGQFDGGGERVVDRIRDSAYGRLTGHGAK